MNRNILIALVVSTLCLITACNNSRPEKARASGAQDGLVSMERHNCNDSIGINGKWRLFKLREGGKDRVPGMETAVIISSCSQIQHYNGGKLAYEDQFTLYKVIQYCDDFQLIFRNDSTCCANFHTKDTLIIGECNNHEALSYYFARQ